MSDAPAVAGRREIGALVIGGEHPGLGIARSLGSRGIPVVLIDDYRSIGSFSRYVSRFVKVDDLRDECNAIKAVIDVGRRYDLRNWVLFPTKDETVAAFSRHRDLLAEFFKVTTPAWDTVQWAWNKRKTYELATQLGIPCPQTFTVRGPDELQAFYSRLPIAVKPAVKEMFFYATGAKAWRANTIDELHEMYAEASKWVKPEEVLLQEIIPGGGGQQVSYCAFFRDGRARSVLLACRQRQHPREFGRAATYVETIELPVIEELSERFLKAIDYYGLVEIEFKQDPRDGQYKLLDVNARAWGFHALGCAAGVDFPYLLFADQLGQHVDGSRGLPGVGWLRLVTDIPTAFSEMLRGGLGVGAYVQSLRRTRVESVFASADLMPSIAEIVLLPYLAMKKYLI
jgi:D-aspartate ligase